MSNFIEKLLNANPLNKIERMLTGRNEMAAEAEKKEGDNKKPPEDKK